MPAAPPTATSQPSSRPWLALALTFLLLGLGYSLPFRLVDSAPVAMFHDAFAPEILNLYAVTAFAGWAHFLYAGRGQFSALARLGRGRQAGFWAMVGLALLALAMLRWLLGIALFSGLVWIWFIAHFVKAEIVFAGLSATSQWVPAWRRSLPPVVAFAWFSFVVFNVFHIQQHRWLLFTIGFALGTCLLLNSWTQLKHGPPGLPVLSLFLLGESLVWGTYGPYMTPAFRVGVYVFHIAGASFFHYLGSYIYGRERTADRLLNFVPVVAINLVVILLGSIVAAGQPSPIFRAILSPVLGIDWFTLWVALHLAASDLLPVWKRIEARNPFPAHAGPR